MRIAVAAHFAFLPPFLLPRLPPPLRLPFLCLTGVSRVRSLILANLGVLPCSSSCALSLFLLAALIRGQNFGHARKTTMFRVRMLPRLSESGAIAVFCFHELIDRSSTKSHYPEIRQGTKILFHHGSIGFGAGEGPARAEGMAG